MSSGFVFDDVLEVLLIDHSGFVFTDVVLTADRLRSHDAVMDNNNWCIHPSVTYMETGF